MNGCMEGWIDGNQISSSMSGQNAKKQKREEQNLMMSRWITMGHGEGQIDCYPVWMGK